MDYTDYLGLKDLFCILIFILKFMGISDLKYSDITGKIIGCAFNVYNKLGSGYMEVIYQRALALEMRKADLIFTREHEMPVFYDEQEVGIRRADFIVEHNIMVELKAVTELNDIHLNQALNYLKAFKLDIGLLINFGSSSLQFKRLIYSKSSK